MTPVFDRRGRVCGWIASDRVLDLRGQTIGWVHGTHFFSRRGHTLGHFSDGFFRVEHG
ncbi:4-fold beta flower protein [Diaminobutyricibacter tongyongensis]|uniref:4-fold beta flower protein n=1 Tax=Leifsonia tongyongensis TaxID=1268043 RepID=UPI003B82E0CF